MKKRIVDLELLIQAIEEYKQKKETAFRTVPFGKYFIGRFDKFNTPIPALLDATLEEALVIISQFYIIGHIVTGHTHNNLFHASDGCKYPFDLEGSFIVVVSGNEIVYYERV